MTSNTIRTFEFLKPLLTRKLVSPRDLAGMESHDEQMLCLLQQLASQDDDRVRRVAHLNLLSLGRHNEQFCSRVHDLDFADDRRSIGSHEEFAKMVNEKLVPS